MSTDVEVRITRELPDQALFGEPILRFFQRLMLLAHSKAAQPGIVPIDEGYLRASLSPGGGVTEAGGDFNNGFFAQVGSSLDYGGILAESETHHYASGPSEGRQTKGWLEQIIPSVTEELPALGASLAGEITAAANG